MNKENVAYIHTGLLLFPKNEEKILLFATTWMNLEVITLNEIKQKLKAK